MLGVWPLAMPGVPQAEAKVDEEKIDILLRSVESFQDLSDFALEYCTRDFCTRLLGRYDGDVERSRQVLESSLRWRGSHEELLTHRRFQEITDLRLLGQDREGRPLLYLCARNQIGTQGQGLDQFVVRMLEAVEAMPRGVRRMVQVWDMHGLIMRLNLNPAPILQLLSLLEGYFVGQVQRIILIDFPRAALVVKKAVWAAVPVKLRERLLFLNAEEAAAHFQSTCKAATASKVLESIRVNRNSSATLEERRRGWIDRPRAFRM